MARKNSRTGQQVNSKRKNKNTERIALVVTGMHRSGTSALARMLSVSGAALPKTLLPASSSNEAGFFESVAINRLNDKIFQSAKANWRSWQSMPTDWDQASNIQALRDEAIATLEAEFGSASPILLKDPRFCRLMRFWLPVLEAFDKSPVIVCPIRNPLEVAASLEHRNGLPKDLNFLIWLRYQLEAEYDTRGLPRAFTHYNSLLADWRQVLGKIVLETGVSVPHITDQVAEELTASLSPKLHHHRFPDAAALHDESCPEWVRAAYAIFLKWSEKHEDADDYALLDQIRSEFDSIPHSLRGILNTGHTSIEAAGSLRKKLAKLEAERAESERHLIQSDKAADIANTSLLELKTELVETQQRQEQLQQLLGQKEAEARLEGERSAELQDKLNGLSEHARELGQRLAQREVAVETANTSLQELKAELVETQQRQEQLQQLLGQKEAEARLQGERSAELQEKLNGLSEHARELGQHLAQREAAIEIANANLLGLKSELVEAQQRQEQFQLLLGQKEAEARSHGERNAELQEKLDGLEKHAEELGQHLVQHEVEARLQGERNAELQEKLDSLSEHARELGQHLALREATVEMANASLLELKSELVEAQQRQEQLQQLLGQKEAEVRLQGWRNVELQEKLDGLSEHARELGQRLAQREAAGETANASLLELKSELVNAQRRQDDISRQLGERDLRVNGLLLLLKSRDIQLAEREHGLKEAKEQLNELKQQLSERETDAYSRKLEIEGLTQKFAESTEKLASAMNELDLLQRKSAYIGFELDRVQRSAVWKFQRVLSSASRQLLLYFSLPRKLPDRDLVMRIAGSILFDRSWYLKQYQDVAAMQLEPALHYLRFGAHEMRDPGPRFSTQFYLEKYPDVASGGINPLVHYEQFGRKEGREIGTSPRMFDLPVTRIVAPESIPQQEQPLPENVADTSQNQEVGDSADLDIPAKGDRSKEIASSEFFDPAWYLKQYPDVTVAEIEPALHYLRFGAAEMRDPGPRFSTRFYLEKYPDVDSGGINPLVHYELFGRMEGREIVAPESIPTQEAEAEQPLPENVAGTPQSQEVGVSADLDIPAQDDGSEEIAGSEFFDSAWYLEQYPDVAVAQIDPALHYLRFGAHEMRDPGPRFSTQFYLEKYPDVASGEINPLVHYEQSGRKDGREIAFSKQAAIVPGYIYSPVSNPDTQAIQVDDSQRVRWKRFSVIPQYPEGLTIELSGKRLGWMPFSDGQDSTLPKALLESLATFGHLIGVPAAESIRLKQGTSDSVCPDQMQAEDALDLPILAFPDSGLTIESVWYLNDQDMRLRFSSSQQGTLTPFVVRFFQYDPARGGSLVLVGEHLLLGQEIEFADISLINAYLPILVTLSQPDARLLSASLLPYPSLCQGGAHFPELLVTGNAANSMESLREVSLELLRAHMSTLSGRTRWELGRVDVDLRGALGAERIFSRDFKEWLWTVMQIELKATVDQPNLTDQSYWLEALSVSQELKDECLRTRIKEREQTARLTMACPPNAIPSIHALVAGQENGGLGSYCALWSYVVADALSREARWRVEMPTFVSEWHWAQHEGKAIGHPFIRPKQGMDILALTQKPDGRAPIALLDCDFSPQHPSTLILPIAPEICGPLIKRESMANSEVDSIHCIYACERYEPQDFLAFLESLRLQKNIELANIFIALYPGQENDRQSIENALQQFFPDRFHLIEVADEKTDAEVQSQFDAMLPNDGGGVLWVKHNVVLHDPRTLETLWQIARDEQVASAGCLLLRTENTDKSHSVRFVSAGLIPVSEQFATDGQCVEIDGLPIFSRSTYPVAANTDAFHVARTDVWKSLWEAAISEHEEGFDGVDYTATALRRGYLHFCTTLVSAELRETIPEKRWVPPGDMQAAIQAASVRIEVLQA